MAKKEEGLRGQGTLLVQSESAGEGMGLACRYPKGIRPNDGLLSGSRTSASAGRDSEASLGLNNPMNFPKTQNPGTWVWPPGKVTSSPSLDVFKLDYRDSGMLPWGPL